MIAVPFDSTVALASLWIKFKLLAALLPLLAFVIFGALAHSINLQPGCLIAALVAMFIAMLAISWEIDRLRLYYGSTGP